MIDGPFATKRVSGVSIGVPSKVALLSFARTSLAKLSWLGSVIWTKLLICRATEAGDVAAWGADANRGSDDKAGVADA